MIKKNKTLIFFTLIIQSFFCLIFNTAYSKEKFKVVTTFTVIADIAKNVAGNAATVVSITKPNAEIHNYQVTPGDLVRAQGANLIIYNGLGLETWFDKFYGNFKEVPVVVVTKGIHPLSIVEGPYEGKPNPHAWMSPSNGIIYVDNIRDALIKYDPNNASTYKKNAEIYINRIQSTINPIRREINNIPTQKRWLVSSEGAFSYLAHDFGLKELYLWPINSDAQGTPQHIKYVIDLMKDNDINVIFSESTVSPKPAKKVASETGAKYGGVLYVDSLSEKKGPVSTYLDLISVTSDRIVSGIINS